MSKTGDYLTDPGQPDTDTDGMNDRDETVAGTDPTSDDSDGDGENDLEELLYGSDPTDPSVTWQPHRPETPEVAPPGVAALRDHRLDVARDYYDPDGDALLLSEWQISTDEAFSSLVMNTVSSTKPV